VVVSVGRLPKDGPTHKGHSQGMPWITLPREHSIPVPELPGWRAWHPSTLAWWRELWQLPQATQWDPTGESLTVMALLMNDVFIGKTTMQRASAELRQWGDRHGLSPKSMVNLRWRIAPETDSAATPVLPVEQSSSTARRARLRVLTDGGVA
jgi:hypothetical protein